MNKDWDDNESRQEEKTASIFGEKTIAENAAVSEKKPEKADNVQNDRKNASGKVLTAVVAAIVVIAGIAGIMIWQSGTGEENVPAAEEIAEQDAPAASEEENGEDLTEENDNGTEPAVNDTEAEKPASGEEEKAKKLYELLEAYNEIRVEDGYAEIMEIIPEGPVEEIKKLMRTYTAGEDIAEVSLEWEKYGQAPVYYMNELQSGEALEYTYPAGKTKDGEDIVLYINTEESIYYIGTTSSPICADGRGTVYYNVKADALTGLVDFYIYDGLWEEGKPGEVGEIIHVVDEMSMEEGRMESQTNAYRVDQNGNALTFYDIYNNEGGRQVEESSGNYEESTVPEWEFGEY